LKIDAGVGAISSLRGKRHVPVDLTFQKCDIDPGSRTITTSDQNDLFLLDSQSKSSDEGKQTVDVLKHPLAKVTLRKSVFASSLDWER
jgi:hypothetical protein